MPDMPQSILSTLLMVVGPIILLAAIAYGTFQSSRRRMAATDKTRERATRQIYERGAQEEARASAAPVPALAASLASRISGTGWIAIFVLGVVLFGGLAWLTSGDRTPPGVVPDATTGQGAPTPSPPATNR
jgi:amino acid transporter